MAAEVFILGGAQTDFARNLERERQAGLEDSSTKGKSVDEVLAIKNTHIVEELSLPPVKIHCSVLAEDAIKAALADYQKKADKTEAAG